MRVRLSDRGMADLQDCPAYRKYVLGRPSFDVEQIDDCFIDRLTGCSFSAAEVEPAHHTGPEEQ